MRPIHKACAKDNLRPAMEYIQIKNNLVVATNGFALAVLPVSECFPAGVVADNEHLYIKGEDWAAGKMDKAEKIERAGLLLTAFDKKGKLIGACKMTKEADADFRFPDWPGVVPRIEDRTELHTFGIDPKYLVAAKEILRGECCIRFFNRSTIIKDANEESRGYVLVIQMAVPDNLSRTDWYIPPSDVAANHPAPIETPEEELTAEDLL